MAPNNNDTRRSANPTQAGLVITACASFIFGLVGIGGNIQQAVLGTGLVVFAGLLLASAAIRDSIANLRKND